MPVKNVDKVRGSSTGRPIMVLLDILGKRWTLRIMWELRDRPMTFRDLQKQCGDISPTTLNSRLRELRDLEIINHGDGGYGYTPLGAELGAQMTALDSWSRQWADQLGAN
ncbi:MAG: helix-turn-helix domain-containing protein [Parasphingorhabdus sp.]|uniref:winged helix-turn-helix transcriptional regulator n=1 Tax=Parasphingorhabdus sp. TaxID=2709688 RepID=UPI0032990E09